MIHIAYTMKIYHISVDPRDHDSAFLFFVFPLRFNSELVSDLKMGQNAVGIIAKLPIPLVEALKLSIGPEVGQRRQGGWYFSSIYHLLRSTRAKWRKFCKFPAIFSCF